MRRFHAFEFTDLPWWPASLRSLLTAYLQRLTDLLQPFLPAATLLAEIVRETGQTRFVDLCSGSGGPWRTLIGVLREMTGEEVSVLLTDKHPNPTTIAGVRDIMGLSYEREPVDAAAMTPSIDGIRTFFNGFHHMAPRDAMAVLNNAVECNAPVAIFEMLQRSFRDVILFAMAPIGLLLVTPWIRPLDGRRIALLTFHAAKETGARRG